MSNKRNNTIDIIKAYGIIFMVAGHCGAPFTSFIYLFHMALFFIASGYCYKENSISSFVDFIHYVKKKVLRLWLPYFIWTLIFTLLHNPFIFLNIYTTEDMALGYESLSVTENWGLFKIIRNIVSGALFHGTTDMTGALWFFATLFELSVVYAFINYCLEKFAPKRIMVGQILVSLVFLVIGYYCSIKNIEIFGIERVLSVYCLYEVGFLIKKYTSSFEVKTKQRIILFVSAVLILIICSHLGGIEINKNQYVNPVFLLIASFAGWISIYELSEFTKKLTFLNKMLVIVGRNTMSVVIFHFLAFKIVNLAGILINDDPIVLLSSFPILYREGLWWVLYLLVGVSIPVVASILYKKVLVFIDKTFVKS